MQLTEVHKLLQQNEIPIYYDDNDQPIVYKLWDKNLKQCSSFSKVYDCGEYYVKKIDLKGVGKDKIERVLKLLNNLRQNLKDIEKYTQQKAEIEIQNDKQYKNVLRLREYYYHKDLLFIVTEKYKSNLADFLKQKGNLGYIQTHFIIQHIVLGYAQMFQLNEKIKVFRPTNILVDFSKPCQIKVADYGLRQIIQYKKQQGRADKKQRKREQQQQKQQYENTAPEIYLKTEACTPQKNVVWGVGLLYYRLLRNQSPWGSSPYTQFIAEYDENERNIINQAKQDIKQKIKFRFVFYLQEKYQLFQDCMLEKLEFIHQNMISKCCIRKQFNYLSIRSPFIQLWNSRQDTRSRFYVGSFRDTSLTNMPALYKLRNKSKIQPRQFQIFQCDQYSVKVINLQEFHPKRKRQIEQKLKILCDSNFKNVAKIYQYFYEGNQTLYVVMQNCKTNLERTLSDHSFQNGWQEIDILNFFKQMLNGFDELRKLGFAQNFAFLWNIYILNKQTLKVNIFPLSQSILSLKYFNLLMNAASCKHIDPHIFRNNDNSWSLIYSLGIILCYMFNCNYPDKRKKLDTSFKRIIPTSQTALLMYKMHDSSIQSRINWHQMMKQFQNVYDRVRYPQKYPKQCWLTQLWKSISCFGAQKQKKQTQIPQKVLKQTKKVLKQTKTENDQNENGDLQAQWSQRKLNTKKKKKNKCKQ